MLSCPRFGWWNTWNEIISWGGKGNSFPLRERTLQGAEGKGHFLPAGFQIKCSLCFPGVHIQKKKKSCSDPQNNPKRAMGRFDNGTVHWERAKGLKSPSYQAAYRESIIPCLSDATCSGSRLSFPHWIVFSHLLLQMFQGHWKLESPVSDRAGEQIGGGLRGTSPEWGSPFFQHSSCLSHWKQGMQSPDMLHNRLWLNFGWTFPHKTR